ncbi:MAG: hypothetical protein RXS23_00020 [Metallosphaera yellowstonensis]|jgi:hypothetical protein|uniref:Uncharacterized protein n=1 Tax=Metallosphaera yellowstonensis MK1 TaxID=671065 RepID=H2C8F3_9CREN|nr:hypothetical protein [Metallosphaera yellowstonensis]EHP68429.1 hypothetical protein MetMK1DRAFT_00028620 [Metallosphaera yellowstonensis MK1]
MKRVAEILVVEDFTGKTHVSEKDIRELVSSLSNVDMIRVNRLHVPQWEGESEVVGIHLIVREVAET